MKFYENETVWMPSSQPVKFQRLGLAGAIRFKFTARLSNILKWVAACVFDGRFGEFLFPQEVYFSDCNPCHLRGCKYEVPFSPHHLKGHCVD